MILCHMFWTVLVFLQATNYKKELLVHDVNSLMINDLSLVQIKLWI
jgi:hypothetical protein